jgi:hypothetical protein
VLALVQYYHGHCGLNIKMQRRGVTTGSSGAELSDLNPEHGYDIDVRRLDPEERGVAERSNAAQPGIAKYFRAAKAAGKFQQSSQINEPTSASHGDRIGRGGSTNYADKPAVQFGKYFV